MSLELLNHSPDLKRLYEEGYELEIVATDTLTYGIIHNVPYVNENREICKGKLVSHLQLSGNATIAPDTHVAYFVGTFPCRKDGNRFTGLVIGEGSYPTTPNLTAQLQFSSRPAEGCYTNYYDKFKRYCDILSIEAKAIDETVTPRTYNRIAFYNMESVFNYFDTNSSKSHIGLITNRLSGQKIGIIGLGGTGSYILDQVAKTPVSEIHIFDGDLFQQHNAFRAPGAPLKEQLSVQIKKTDYLVAIYSKMHRFIIPHGYYIEDATMDELASLSFVFICIDNGEARKKIVDYLLAHKIPFIDTGLGVDVVDGKLLGMVRMTAVTPEKNDHTKSRIEFCDGGEDDVYSSNIQIADLNALNALLAVIKWKKICGFYIDLKHEHNTLYTISRGSFNNEDFF
jgi:hypothetical protein